MKKMSVLIIDDSEIDRYILTRQLNEIGVDGIFECADGAEALTFLQEREKNQQAYPDKFPPVVIFLDINMPLVGGFEFLESFANIREELAYQSSVIMMYSSSEHPDEKAKALKYEYVTDYVVKGSVSAEQLKEKLETLLPG